MAKQQVQDTRVAAALALTGVMRDGLSLSQTLAEASERVNERDRGLLQELCFGTARYSHAFELIAKKLLSKTIKKKETEVKALLFLGLYQLLYTRIPDHAAINSVVDACKKLKKNWATGLLNGVLRNFIREQEDITQKLESNPVYEYSHPQWLIERLRKAWPKDWQQILAANNAHPPFCLRINQRQIDRDSYAQQLAGSYALGEYSSEAIVLEQAQSVLELPGYNEGQFAVQDEAAQLSAQLLNLTAGQRVLDACCAPGGKSCHILETEPNLKELVALDVDAKRMVRVEENLARLQLSEKATLKVSDATQLDNWWNGESFDRILLDAPCSATGVIRRHPDIKLLRRPDDIAKLAQVQQQILSTLWQTLTPGGYLVYATCSVLPQENENTVLQFVEQTNDASHIPIKAQWGIERPAGRQLFPQVNGHDGFYYARLQKNG